MGNLCLDFGLDYDDVLVIPRQSDVSSRDDVDISFSSNLRGKLKLSFPLIASPMVGVVDGKFAKALSDLGGLAIFHRFYETREELLKDISENVTPGVDKYGISVKVGEENYEEFFEDKYIPSILLIDTANGYSPKLHEYCFNIKNFIEKHEYETALMSGNVATREGCASLANSGCDFIRVGIGSGSVCSTRNKTGVGLPAISSLFNCVDYTDSYLVIDGGIKNSGDFVKAIVAGADLGMSGKLFAECYEAPCKDTLYGMASKTHMVKTGKEIKSVEGYDISVTKKHSLEQFVREFGYGIKSAGTYLNARTLYDMYQTGCFIRVSDHAIKKEAQNL